MPISSAKASCGITAIGTPTGANLSGAVQISGSGSADVPAADVAYAVRCVLVDSGDTFELDLATGSTSGSTAFVAGTYQEEVATAAGTISTSGDASVVVTAAGMTGSPKTINVAVTSGDTAAMWADKVRLALAADPDVSELFAVSGASTSIALIRLPVASYTVPGGTLPIYTSDDATLNIALDNGTCSGITPAATSADIGPGTATSGAKIYNGEEDFEGNPLPVCTAIHGLLIANASTSAALVADSMSGAINPGASAMETDAGGITPFTLTIGCAGAADFTVTVIGSTI